MVEQLVLIRLRSASPPELEGELIRRLLALKAEIPAMLEGSAGRNFNEQYGRGWQVGARALFRDRQAFESYVAHPAHQEFAAWLEDVAEEFVVVDFER